MRVFVCLPKKVLHYLIEKLQDFKRLKTRLLQCHNQQDFLCHFAGFAHAFDAYSPEFFSAVFASIPKSSANPKNTDWAQLNPSVNFCTAVSSCMLMNSYTFKPDAYQGRNNFTEAFSFQGSFIKN